MSTSAFTLTADPGNWIWIECTRKTFTPRERSKHRAVKTNFYWMHNLQGICCSSRRHL